MEKAVLDSTQRYAACALLTLALNQSQIHQSHLSSALPSLQKEPLGDGMSAGSVASVSDRLWIYHDALLLPVFKFLQVDLQTLKGIKKTAAASTQLRHHVESFLDLLKVDPPEKPNREIVLLAEAVDAMASALKIAKTSSDQRALHSERKAEEGGPMNLSREEVLKDPQAQRIEKHVEAGTSIPYEIKITFLYELLSACLLGTKEGDKDQKQCENGYDSRHRIAMRLLATWLDVEWIKMEALEIIVAASLMGLSKGETSAMGDSENSNTAWDQWKNRGMIGGAALAGGTVMAITGGLLAPAVAQGLGALAPTMVGLIPAIGMGGFAAATAAAGAPRGSAAVAASFGALRDGLAGRKVADRPGGVEEFEFKALGRNHNQGRLAVGILVSGLVFKEEDFSRPWEGAMGNLERYVIQWETKNLIGFSTAIEDWQHSKIMAEIVQRGAMMSVLSTLLAVNCLPATLLSVTEAIDCKWAVALDRSDQAGKLLAETLIEGHHGKRPVTLVGFSLGARVIFRCLQCLAEAEGDNAGLIEGVVFIGAPLSIKEEVWAQARKMVAGRFVNVYSTNDWTLGIAFRDILLSSGVAGVQPVEAPGIENVDGTQFVESHVSYLGSVKHILARLELECYNPVWKSPAK